MCIVPIGARLREKLPLVLVLLAAILIRLPIAVSLGDQLTGLPAIHDQVSYDALARSLLAGHG